MEVSMHTHIKLFSRCIISIAVIAISISACSTLPHDVQFTTELSDQYASLQELTIQATSVRLNADIKQAQLLQKEIQKAIKAAQSESILLASLHALLGQMQVLLGDQKSAETNLNQSRALNPGCEDSFILEALLKNDINEKIKLLSQGITKADSSQRLRCELGILLFNNGSYAEAIAQFDTALPFMTQALATLYQPIRDKAQEYLQAGIKPTQIISDQFTLEKMILITHSETTLLVWFTGIERWDIGVLFERMKGSGWFPDTSSNPTSLVRRKDAALFFWYVITKGDSVKLYRYTEKYKTRGTSPVDDVPYGSPWFNAVLGVIEEDIMKLKDGKFFEPDAVMTEIEFRKALQVLLSIL